MRCPAPFMLVVAVLGSGCGTREPSRPVVTKPSPTPSVAADSPASSPAPVEVPAEAPGRTPEAALRQFLGAMLANDGEGVRANALPNPDIDALLASSPLTPDQLAQARAQFDTMPIRALSVGDSIAIPGKGTLVFDDTLINDDHQVLMMPGGDLPIELVRIDGAWKVDASPLIAARKAAQAVRGTPSTATEPGAGPEVALRSFLGAMLLGDREGVVASALPHPEIDILLSSDLTSPEQRAAVKAQVDAMPVTVLAVGDEVALPDGRRVVADDTMISADKRLLTFAGNPIPFEVVRVDGLWKVNPAPIIEARKAARAARR